MTYRRRLTFALMTLGVISLAPMLMAPVPGCDSCQRTSGNLDGNGVIDYTTGVTNGVRYEAFAEVSSGGVQVNVTGSIQSLACNQSGNQGWCTFEATSTANVTVELDGTPNAAYVLYFGAI